MTPQAFRASAYCGALHLAGFIALLVCALPRLHAEHVEDSINADIPPWHTELRSQATEIGWFYKPKHSYVLNEVQTSVGAADGRTLTLQVWQGDPTTGGVLLRTAPVVVSAPNVFLGGKFAPVPILAGQTYFIGYLNTAGLSPLYATPGPNTTPDIGYRFGKVGDGTYPTYSRDNSWPLFRFLGPDLDHSVAFLEGDPVTNSIAPGQLPDGSVWTSVGTPAINDHGDLAVAAKWKNRRERGSGIFAAGRVIAKSGDHAPGIPNATFVSFSDPVFNESGSVAFLAKIEGQSITSSNNAVVAFSSAGGPVIVVAQTGKQATGLPAGTLWKSFSIVALSDNRDQVLFTGSMIVGSGAIANDTDQGLWGQDSAGQLRLLLQSGTTVVAGKTLKSFLVLKAVSGATGQTRAFNNANEVTYHASFTDGTQGAGVISIP